MNFCRLYNKTMNGFERISVKCDCGYMGSHCEDNHYSEEAYPRKNRKEINIFVGIFYILIAMIAVLIVCSFGGLFVLLDKIYTSTTSHCDLEEK